MKRKIQWAAARLMSRFGLPYWWVTPKWTQVELNEVKKRALERYEQVRQNFS